MGGRRHRRAGCVRRISHPCTRVARDALPRGLRVPRRVCAGGFASGIHAPKRVRCSARVIGRARRRRPQGTVKAPCAGLRVQPSAAIPSVYPAR